MKRFISILLAAVMLLSLVGCGTSEEKTEEVIENSVETNVPERPLEEDPDYIKFKALASEGDLYKICAEVTTVEDCAKVLVAAGIKEGGNGDLDFLFVVKNLHADKLLDVVCLMLTNDYDEVGRITTSGKHNYLYVKEAGKYHLYDILRVTSEGFPNGITSDTACDTKEELTSKAAELLGHSSASVFTPSNLIAQNGRVVFGDTTYGVQTFHYAETTIPVGLGLPKLTDEEIDALLAANDPRKVKDTITTLADFANYCYRGEFIFGDGLIYFVDENGRYVQTTSSGYQTLQMRMGQCASMSSCLRYVLDGDYDETGYVVIDQHIMAYILCDGLYYLVNPVEYVSIAYKNYLWCSTWLGYLMGGKGYGTFCSADFQDIADSLYGKDIGTEITYVYTMTGPGDFARNGTCNGPEGTTVIRWYGSDPVSYFSFTEYDWMSQENIVDRDAIVMFPSPGGQWVTFGGIHEDSYTAAQYPNGYLK